MSPSPKSDSLKSRLLDVPDEAQLQTRAHVGGKQLDGIHERTGRSRRIDRAHVRQQDLAVVARSCGRRPRHLGGVEAVGHKLKFFVGLFGIARVNLVPRCLGHRDHRRRIGNCLSLDATGRLLRARTVAEGEADEFEGRCNPLITEVGNDGQIWKLLAEFLDRAEDWRTPVP